MQEQKTKKKQRQDAALKPAALHLNLNTKAKEPAGRRRYKTVIAAGASRRDSRGALEKIVSHLRRSAELVMRTRSRGEEEGFFDCVPRPPKSGGKTKNAGLRSE
jgi:hypothetical protein